MKKFKIKRWMVISTIIAGLGATVALASCQSSVGGGSGTVTCTTEDCNTETCNTAECDNALSTDGCTINSQGCAEQGCNEAGCNETCSNSSYVCDGQRLNCNQYACYDQTYTCGDTDGWFDCVGDCTTTCTRNCTEANCNGGGANCAPSATDCTLSPYKRRQLHRDEDYKLHKSPVVNTTAEQYDLTLEISFDIELLVKCKNIEITYKIIYYGNDYKMVTIEYEDSDALYDAMVSESIFLEGAAQYGEPDGYALIIYSIYADVKN